MYSSAECAVTKKKSGIIVIASMYYELKQMNNDSFLLFMRFIVKCYRGVESYSFLPIILVQIYFHNLRYGKIIKEPPSRIIFEHLK